MGRSCRRPTNRVHAAVPEDKRGGSFGGFTVAGAVKRISCTVPSGLKDLAISFDMGTSNTGPLTILGGLIGDAGDSFS